jgi:hypothetical protein
MMTKTNLFSIAIVLLTSIYLIANSNQKRTMNNDLVGLKNTILKLLPQGKSSFSLMGIKKKPASMQNLILKKEKEIHNNYQIIEMPDGKLISITKYKSVDNYFEEYEELQKLKEESYSKTAQLIDGIIEHGISKIVVRLSREKDSLVQFEFDLDNMQASVNGNSLKFKDSIIVNSTNNVYNEKWIGYKWDSDFKKKSIKSHNVEKRYTLTIGQTKSFNKKRIFALKEKQFYLGHRIKNKSLRFISI